MKAFLNEEIMLKVEIAEVLEKMKNPSSF